MKPKKLEDGEKVILISLQLTLTHAYPENGELEHIFNKHY